MLLDQYGRPIIYEALTQEQAGPTLAGIRNIYSSIDASFQLTPQKITSVLRQAEFGDPWLYLELAERMEEKDERYQGLLHTRKMAVSQLDISILPASESTADQADAEFVEDLLLNGDIDLHDTVFDALDALGKGFSATEIIWDTTSRNFLTGKPQWIPSALKWRDPRWFMFDWISGEQLLVRSLKSQEVPLGSGQPLLSPINLRIVGAGGGQEIGLQPATQPLAPFKFITHITKAKAGLPIRGGLARIAAWNYLFANYVLKDFVAFCEIFGQPLRVGKYGPGATEKDKSLLLAAVAGIGTDAAAIIPDSMLIEFEKVQGTSDSSKVFVELLQYLDKRLTIAILGQELTTSLPKGAGSRAAAEVHDVVRRDIATDDARRVSATFNRDLVKPLIDLNRGPRRRYPQIKIGFEDQEDLSQLSTALVPLIDRGLPVAQSDILDKFGLSQPEEGAPILHPAEKISAQLPGNPAPAAEDQSEDAAISAVPLTPLFTDIHRRKTGKGRHGPANSVIPARSELPGARGIPDSGTLRAAATREGDKQQNTPELDAIDRFVRALRDEESDAAMGPIVRPLLARMGAAKNYAEMKRAIVAAVDEMNHDHFIELMARAGFNVNLAGQTGIRPK
jgi:phage gp29-like protein